MLLYNSLTRKKEEFVPREAGKVSMYTCGPTVYHFAHIGNLRTYTMEDVLEKYLRYVGNEVTRVMNITDVGHLSSDGDTGEDKMLKGAKRENKTVLEIAKFYTDAFFADCKKLFDLNLFSLLAAGMYICAVLFLKKVKLITLARPCGFNLGFWAGVGTLVSFATVGGLAALDFDEAFRVFHMIFFPGKDNWLFNPLVDEVITIMPEEFFMNCAILILTSIVVISLSLIVIGVMGKKRIENKNAGK